MTTKPPEIVLSQVVTGILDDIGCKAAHADLLAAARAAAEKLPRDAMREAAALCLYDRVRVTARNRALAAERRATREQESAADVRLREERPAAFYEPRPGLSLRHGTTKAYQAGCRCESCTGSWSTDPSVPREPGYWLRKITEAVETFKQEVRVEWTRELLASVISLRDGARVSWGEATIDNHLERYEMLTKNAAASAETATRHACAAAVLREAGCATLNEYVARGQE